MDQHVVRVTYHEEAEGWWADSADLEGFVAGAETLAETRRLVREGVVFYLDVPAEQVEIQETLDTGQVVYDYSLRGTSSAAVTVPATAALAGRIAVKHSRQSGMRIPA